MSRREVDDNGVFLNKLGITDASELKAAEYALTARRMAELASGRFELDAHGFGLERLRSIHQYLFQDVYAWAGQLRTAPSSKRAENGLTSVFEAPEAIDSSWRALGAQTAAFASDKTTDLEGQRDRLVSLYVEANRIHPFLEGNGRSLQLFMRQLAGEQALELDFTRTHARDWNLACAVSGMHGRLFEHVHLIPQAPDLRPIRRIFGDVVRPARAVAFERLPENQACARFPELRGAYAGLRAIEDRVRGVAVVGAGVADVAGYMRQVRAAFVKRLDEGLPFEPQHPPVRNPRDRDSPGRS